MKKLSLVLAGWLAVSAMAWANDVKWFVNWGVYTHDATDLVSMDSGAVLDSYDVRWQLIHAGADNAIDPVDVANASGGYVSGDDVVLDTRVLSRGNSGIFDNYLYTDDDNSAVTSLSHSYSEDHPYYVYQRIYESQTPVAGTHYYESGMVKLDSDYASGSQTIALGSYESGIQANHQIPVPEPAVQVVTFDGNGGAPGAASNRYTIGQAYGELPGATWALHEFEGWWTAAEDGEPVAATNIVTEEAARTLHAHWTDGVRTNGVVWKCEVNGEGTVKVTGADPTVGDMVMPETLGGYTVTAVGTNAFKGCTDLAGMALAAGVTNIGAGAFAGCTGLETVTLPAGLLEIGNGAFKGCQSLGAVEFPAGMEEIGVEAFSECLSLREALMPDSVATVGGSAFLNATNLATVRFGAGVESVGAGALFCRTGGALETVYLPATTAGAALLQNAWLPNGKPEGCRVLYYGTQTVTFDADGGTCEVAEKGYAIGEVYGELPEAERGGFEFEGWRAADGTAVTTNSIVPAEEATRTLVAQWKAARGVFITEQPEGRTVQSGDSVTFSVGVRNHAGVSIPLDASTSMELVFCPAGTFEMGSPDDELGRGGNETRHTVTLTHDFWLGKYEVKQKEYVAGQGWNSFAHNGDDNLPVETVTHVEAEEFCAKMTENEKSAGRLPEGYLYTLPTEAEWEYACRAGTTQALNSGRDLTNATACTEMDEVGWYKANGGGQTHLVGQKRPNAWGLFDMHGNVEEWCWDWYQTDYPAGAATNPPGPSLPNSDCVYVRRGGSWNQDASGCRSAARRYAPQANSDNQCGFRVALSRNRNVTVPLSDTVSMSMVWVGPGTFLMGSPSGELGRKDDETQHDVTLTEAFWLGRFEVTQAQWEEVMEGKPDAFDGLQHDTGDNLPIYYVSRDEALDFCARLTARERAAGRLAAGWKFSLPTEAQWEYACRGGSTKALNNEHDLTSTTECSSVDQVAWYKYNSGDKVHPTIGAKVPNTFGGRRSCSGLFEYDMHGNVREWVLDRYGEYPTGAVTDPTGPEAGDGYILRGGGCADEAEDCRSAARYRSYGSAGDTSGLRVAIVRERGVANAAPEPYPGGKEPWCLTGGVAYQWYRDGEAIEGATGASLTIAGAAVSDAGSYTVTVTAVGESATSAAAVLEVAVERETVDGVEWLYVGNGEGATVVGANPAAGDLTMPETLGGAAVTEVGAGAFQGCTNLTGMAIAGGVTNVGANAFAGCGSLESVRVPVEQKDTGLLDGAGLPEGCAVRYYGTQTVTFDAAGGTCAVATNGYEIGKAYGELPVAERGVYEFDGWWAEDGNGGWTQVTATNLVTEEAARTLVAQWKWLAVPYVERGWDGSAGTESDAVCTNFTVYNGQMTLTSGWYVVAGNVKNTERITVSGDVHLILCDGAALTALEGIELQSGFSLIVYGQSGDSGTLFAGTDGTTDADGRYKLTGDSDDAGIGGCGLVNGGAVTVHGGMVVAVGRDGAGIGGGRKGDANGKVAIYGGAVTAQSNDEGAGIGGGFEGNGGIVAIYGGTVTAQGGGAAIGRGEGGREDGILNLGEMKVTEPAGTLWREREDTCHKTGTTVRLEPCRMHEFGEDGKCKWCGAAFRPVPYVERGWDGGAVTESEAACTNFAYLAGQERLESGWYVVADNVTNNNRITVSGDVRVILCDRRTLTVPQGFNVAKGNSLTVYGQGGDSGRLFAGTDGTTDTNGKYIETCPKYCAGIGGDDDNSGGEVTLHGGTVVAAGGGLAAGIGGSRSGLGWGSAVTVYGGTVTARGGADGAGIGSGHSGNMPGEVTIYGGKVAATGGLRGAGIGGGWEVTGGKVAVYGGTVAATGGHEAAGIGSGSGRIGSSSGGDVTIHGGTVTATGGDGGAAIGRGKEASGGDGKLDIAGMRVTDPAGTLATNRVEACRAVGGSVTLEVCGPHEDGDGDGFCDYCGTFCGPVAYWDPVAGTNAVCTNYTAYAGEATLTSGWWVVSGSVTNAWRIVVDGDVHLILMDGAALVAQKGVDVAVVFDVTNRLTVWAQSDGDGMGRLTATASNTDAGIGGNDEHRNAGAITINGGMVDASCSVSGGYNAAEGAGIGGGHGGAGGTVTVNGGVVTASCVAKGSYLAEGAGIGGGYGGGGGTVIVNGGTVDASCRAQYDALGAGIGGGCDGGGGIVVVNGGTVTAGCATDGDRGYAYGAGIGGGQNADGGNVTINGGTVTATAGAESEAIGRGRVVYGSHVSGDLTFGAVRVTDPAGTLATNRVEACRAEGESVKLEECVPHEYEGEKCKWCGTANPVEKVEVQTGAGSTNAVITFTLARDIAGEAPEGAAPRLVVTAFDTATGERAVADASALSADDAARAGTSGGHTVTWNLADAFGEGFVSTGVVFGVEYRYDDVARWCAVDLSGGKDAESYPISYLAEEPSGGFNADPWKTTNLVLRLVEAGTFTMGSPTNELGRKDDETQHEVTLSRPFYIGVFETTQRQWELVTGGRPSWFANADCYATRPVEQVSYDDLRGTSAGTNWPATNSVDGTSFLGILRARTGLALDLPTEAQWEYACRAGTTTALNSGKDLASTDADDNMDEVGRYWHNGGQDYNRDGDTTGGTAAVGSYRPNDWGLYDMHGNVVEWCLDWYGDYPDGAATDPVGASEDTGSGRAHRGGSWCYDAQFCRSACRGSDGPRDWASDTGVRLALPVAGNVPVAERTAAGRASEPVEVQMLKPFAEGDIVVTGSTNVYDGTAHGIVVATNAIEGLELRYGIGASASDFGLSEPPGFTGVTNATVWVQATAPGYFPETNRATVAITPAELTIAAKDQEYAWNGLPQGEGDTTYATDEAIAAKVEAAGLKGEDRIGSVTLSGQATAVGVYSNRIEVTGARIANGTNDVTGNYEIGFAAGTLTIVESWQTVTFDAAGGTCGTATNRYLCGEPYGELPVATRKLHTFDGWKTADGARVAATNIVSLDAELTLVADWLAGTTTNGVRWLCATNGDGTVTVTGAVPTAGDMAMPDALDGFPVTAVGTNAFENCTNLTGMAVADGVTNIGEWAFSECYGLTNVTFGTNVTAIGGFAFYMCTNLTEVAIPGVVTALEEGVFGGCVGLTNVTMGGAVTNIGVGAFYMCVALREVELPEGLAAIGSVAFGGSGLTDVRIPDATTDIAAEAFEASRVLTNVWLGTGIESVGAHAFFNCTNLAAIWVPVEKKEAGLLDGAMLPAGCEIRYYGTQTVTFDANGGTCSVATNGYVIGAPYGELPEATRKLHTFEGWQGTNGAPVAATDPVTEEAERTLVAAWTNGVVVGNVLWLCQTNADGTVTVTGAEPAEGDLVMPDELDGYAVTAVGEDAFRWCTNLTGMTIAAGVTNLAADAFLNCTALGEMAIPDGVTDIGAYAFCGCEGLTNLTIGAGVTNIAENAFDWCTSLESVALPEGLASLGAWAFGYAPLAEVRIPDATVNIGSNAFYGNGALATVWLGTGIESVGEEAFLYCTNLATIWVPIGQAGTGLLDAAGLPEGCEIHYYGTQTVTFEPNGGVCGTATNEYDVEGTYGELPVPMRAEWGWLGWFDAEEGGTEVVEGDAVTLAAERTLWAHWEGSHKVWRFYSKKKKAHFFTISEAEKEKVLADPNWELEGGGSGGWLAFSNQVKGSVAVHRFYSKTYGGHFYTVDQREMETVRDTNPNWKYEGVVYYAYPTEREGCVPVYRFWSKKYRQHFFTANLAEKESLEATNPNWAFEGVAFWAWPMEASRSAASVNSEKRTVKSGGDTGTLGPRDAGRSAGGGVVVTTCDGSDGSAVADGDEGTGWSSDGMEAGTWVWVALSFAETRKMAGVEVVGAGLPEEMRVLVSEDGETWEDAGEEELEARYVWVAWAAGEESAAVREIRVLSRVELR